MLNMAQLRQFQVKLGDSWVDVQMGQIEEGDLVREVKNGEVVKFFDGSTEYIATSLPCFQKKPVAQKAESDEVQRASKTKDELIVELMTCAATFFQAEVSIGSEDGYTWISVWGGQSGYKMVDSICQALADALERPAYFNCAYPDSIEFALNADFDCEGSDIPDYYLDDLSEYGVLFEPKKRAALDRRHNEI